MRTARIRPVAACGALFALGAIFGPVILATARSLPASVDEDDRFAAAYRLIGAYDEHYPQLVMSSVDHDAAVFDCGYQPETLFGRDYRVLSRDWTVYRGYFDLTLWRSRKFRLWLDERRAAYLRQQLSAFATVFLHDCIRSTLFASVCGRRVRLVLERGGHLSTHVVPSGVPEPNQSREDRTICTYLDGLAARNGQSLASRSTDALRQR